MFVCLFVLLVSLEMLMLPEMMYKIVSIHVLPSAPLTEAKHSPYPSVTFQMPTALVSDLQS